MLVYLYRFFCGYITIRIFGDYPERFINLCSFNRIQLWNIRRKNSSIFANISVGDYLKIRGIKKNRSLHIRLVRKKGLYFALRPYFKRKGLAIGVVLFFIIPMVLSQFIWNIEVVGNKDVSSEEILRCCEEINIKEGSIAGNINNDTARIKLLLNNEKLSWASFIVEGSHLTVNVLETKTADIRDSVPNNLIAVKDGIIEKVSVSGGKAVVKKGQTVLKGDMLVTGSLQYADGTTNLVKCDGEVLAITDRELMCETSFSINKSYAGGRTENRKVLSVFGIKLPLSGRPVAYEHTKSFDIQKLTNGSSYSPIFVMTVIYDEIKTVPIKMTPIEAKRYLKKKIKKLEKLDMNGCKILSYTDKFIECEGGLKLIRKYKCVENIVKSEKIKIVNVN